MEERAKGKRNPQRKNSILFGFGLGLLDALNEGGASKRRNICPEMSPARVGLGFREGLTVWGNGCSLEPGGSGGPALPR